MTPEEKLLRAIFGEKAEEVKESCLYVPPGIEGTVVDVRVFSRKGTAKDDRAKSIEEEEVQRLKRDLEDETRIAKEEKFRKLRGILLGQTVTEDVKDFKTKEVICPKGKKLAEKHLDRIKDEYLMRIKIESAASREKMESIHTEANQYIRHLEAGYDERIERVKKR